MAKGLDRMCDKYAVKLSMGKMPCRIDQNEGVQLERYRAAAAMQETLRKAVSETLSRFGIATIWWPYYLDFARFLSGRQFRSLGSEMQRAEGRLRVDLWVSRGLAREVLLAIAAECLNLDLFDLPIAESVKPQ